MTCMQKTDDDFGRDLDSKKTAKQLIDANFPIEMYELLQEQRNRRLNTFIKYNIPVLIKNEKTLIAFGEEVLRLMRENKVKE